MIAADSSAVLAAVFGENDADRYLEILEAAPEIWMSAFNLFECRAVLLRRAPPQMLDDFSALVTELAVRIAPFDAEQAARASEAYSRYGKGSGHRAQLNLGDCAAYALAKSKDLPLLFKGGDFALTDLRSALA